MRNHKEVWKINFIFSLCLGLKREGLNSKCFPFQIITTKLNIFSFMVNVRQIRSNKPENSFSALKYLYNSTHFMLVLSFYTPWKHQKTWYIHRCSIKKRSLSNAVLKMSQYSQENTSVGVCFNKAVDLKACKFIKEIHELKCFQMSIAKFLRTPILKNTWKQWLLYINASEIRSS